MVWRNLIDETLMLYSPIGLRLIDDFTAKPVSFEVNVRLEYQSASLAWIASDISAVMNSLGIISYPGLGRTAYFSAMPVQRYRVLLESDRYIPAYSMAADGIEFDVYPYDDANPPSVINKIAQDTLMIPGPNYLYESFLRLIRGVVQDNSGAPVANAEVISGAAERTLTDHRGAFTLPLRWSATIGPVVIDATDHRTGRVGTITVNLPVDLSHAHVITII